MPRLFRWLAVTVMAGVGCSPMTSDPQLSVAVRPSSINGAGQMAEVTVTAVDGAGKPGAGSVRITSAAGSLVNGTVVMLAAGTASAQFSCDSAADSNCRSSVRLTAEWALDGKRVEAVGNVRILAPDAGSPPVDAGVDAGSADAGRDAGVDAGIPDAGRDAGVDAGPLDAGFDAGVDAGPPGPDAGRPLDAGPFVFDGGTGEAYDLRLLVLNATNRVLLAAAPGADAGQDSAALEVRVVTNTANQLTVADASVEFSSMTGTVVPAQSLSDDQGRASTRASVGSSTPATFLVVEARVGNNFIRQRFTVARAQTIRQTGTAPTRLSISSSAVNTTGTINFEVIDDMGRPVPTIEVLLDLDTASPAGMSVTPARAITNAMGQISVTLSSGLNTGIAKVRASIPLARLEVVSQGVEVVSGRPYDDRLSLSCARRSLGALQSATPPRGLSAATSTLCQLQFADLQGNLPPSQQTVRWISEIGRFDNILPAAPNSGVASAVFGASTYFTNPTTPLPGEPSNGSANPRDGLVTIVAAIEGEEAYIDGSADGGFNGKWDPGEWFVDLGEPFVDGNDNGRYDANEPLINVPQYDCTTGALLPNNTAYDGPNGCRDERTLIWRATHVMYTGSPAFIDVNPPFPSQVAAGATSLHTITITDANLNRISADGISAMVAGIGTPRGMLTVNGVDFAAESFGHELVYETFQVRETMPGVFVNEGPCSAQGSAQYPQQRCTRGYRFGNWRTAPVTARATLTGAMAQAALMDGGIPPPTTSTWEIRISNSLDATALGRIVNVQMP
jgi:hypothetical protein